MTDTKYDAILVVSFGGPEGMEDVMPFLENVLRGKNVPKERMLEVVKHYEQFGGVSPINEHNRQLIKALQERMTERGLNLPIYWGNRNWHPMLADTICQMRDQGVKKALAFVTAAYSSYSACRQYLEDIEKARNAAGANAPAIDKLRLFYNHPLFIEGNAENLASALMQLTAGERQKSKVLFSAHSIPLSMANTCEYKKQLEEASALTFERASKALSLPETCHWELVFQSRSGPPSQAWLEPDVCARIRQLPGQGIENLVLMPIGFVCDHLEVIYDLDTQAAQVCAELEMKMVRAKTVGTHASFISMILELIEERMHAGVARRFLGQCGASLDQCAPDCCPSPNNIR